LLAFPALAGAYVPTPGAVYGDGPSGRYLVGGTWYKRADPADHGLAAGFQRSTRLGGWTRTAVPNAANAGDFSRRSYLGGVYWYRKDFRPPPSTARSSWILRFESVNYRASVWLNGRLLGRHTGSYVPFELEGDGLRRGRVNHLVVRVDSRRGLHDVPSLGKRRGGPYVGGWWNYAGILREVYLRRVDRLDLADVVVRPRLACRTCAATVYVGARIRNRSRRPVTASLRGRFGDGALRFSRVVVPPRSSRGVRARVRMEAPHLWSPDDPFLYEARLTLADGGGRRLQEYLTHTGVRAFTVVAGRLYINYLPARLYGVNMHEDSLERGAALQPADLRQSFELLRQLGATMTRAHYPLHPLTLELADRYGIVVWSEVPVYQMQESLFRDRRVRRKALYLVRSMVRRDRNHASVMVWSLGNENTSAPRSGFRRYLRDGKRAIERLDSTRLTGLAVPGYPTVLRQRLYAGLDALGVNDYFGWYAGPDGSIANRNDLAPYLDRLRRDYPRQALFVTEFGAEASRSGAADAKGTYEFQRDFLAYHFGVIASKPYVNGALVWILRDFRVKPRYEGGNPNPSPPLNAKGLIDDAGVHKLAFDLVSERLHALRAGPTVPP
jgi:beta-glucuronidase